MKINYSTTLLLIIALFQFACKKEKSDAKLPDISSVVLSDFTTFIAEENYKSIAAHSNTMYIDALLFKSRTNNINLNKVRNSWRLVREDWEKSESFLFGPIATNGYDPQIDTWPVNKNDLDSLLNSGDSLTEKYMMNLQESLKGFHPIEYLIFGLNGNKTAAEFTPRELDYLIALSKDVNLICNKMFPSWDETQGNFSGEFKNAGYVSTIYSTKKEAMFEMVNSMIGICDEVANGKIEEPFSAQDPSLEESPFSKNSFTDFKNNMIGVRNVYLCTYKSTGKSLSDFVKMYNSSLDALIKAKLNASVSVFNTFSKSFGEAIIHEQTQILNCQKTINELKSTLETDLINLIQIKVEN